MTRIIRWGILGAGEAAHSFALGLTTMRDARLVAVASRHEASAKEFARRFHIPHWHSDSAPLIDDSDIDIVYVATPNHRHKEHVLHCLNRDKAVVCEKPFATTASDAQEMINVARERELFCMEAMWMRFLPLMRQLDGLVGQVGEVRMLTAQLGHPCAYEPAHRLFNAQMGGGAVLDLGVYLVSLAVQLFGSPTAVFAHGSLAPSGVDEQAVVVLRFPRECLASLSVSLRTEATNDAVILGNRGRIQLHPPLYGAEQLSLTLFEEANLSAPHQLGMLDRLRAYPPLGPWLRRLGKLSGQLRSKGTTITSRYAGNGFQYQAQEAMRCLREGRLESDVMPLDETLVVMQTLDAIRDGLKAPVIRESP